ncbi:MAG: type II toxin-antitoxin system HipA family toxin [Crocinitomicaceae bacterium]|nr:type II toxin-antitoxin system HipA family toxin [Crocinitomicaceae bacterium]
MSKNDLINIFCFGEEIGRLGIDENQNKSYFQYNADFLKSGKYLNLFPKTKVIKRTEQTQVFTKFNNDTFKGVIPMIADSLPDMFGNIIFKKWLESSNKNFNQISVIEQLAYVADRGMGALEYRPSKTIPKTSTVNLEVIISVLKEVLALKDGTSLQALNNEALLNIFKIGTSAGGARPKILISENCETGEIIPGDLNYSSDYNHYLVKLSIDDNLGYSREVIEYCYYLTATHLGLDMMESKLVDQKHFATLRFDRKNGIKKHILTATGMTGWDFKSPDESSYENLFELALFLKVPHKEIEALFKRMVFNVVYCNTDDHLKNHSFIYNELEDKWNLSPVYDLTYSLNPLINYKRISRALSINNKRVDINLDDILKVAETYTIKNAKKTILEIQNGVGFWKDNAIKLKLPISIIQSIEKDFQLLIES